MPPTSKIVLLALADEANDSGFCFPSHQHVAKKCELGERTVRRTIRLLARRNYLTIERRFNKNRSCTSNGYRLATGDHPVKLTRPVVVDAQQILDELSGRMNSTQVRNPISYCAALISRLTRGEFTAELGLQVAVARRAENHRHQSLDEPSDDVMDAVNNQLRQPPDTLSAPLKRMRAKYDSRRSPRCRNDVESTTSPARDAAD